MTAPVRMAGVGLAAGLALFTLCATALAAPPDMSGLSREAPPDMSGLSREAQHELLLALVRANVAGANCTGFESSDSEWKFLTDAADQLADNLELSTDAYDATYYKPAFDALDDDPEFCAREGAAIAPTISHVLGLGGSIDKYKIEG